MLVAVAGPWGVTTGIMVAIALVGLIVAGSLLYGRNSRYGAVAARNRPRKPTTVPPISPPTPAGPPPRPPTAVSASARYPAVAIPRPRPLAESAAPQPQRNPLPVSLFRDKGVVLRSYRLGEADRIVVFLTERHGKVRAVAKGVRKTNSKFGGPARAAHPCGPPAVARPLRPRHRQPGRGRRRVPPDQRGPQPGPPGHGPPRGQRPARTGAPPRPRPLHDAHRRPPRPRRPSPTDPTLVAPSFFLKALVLEGAGPILDECASCGQAETAVELVAFDLVAGGTLCRMHRSGRPLSPPALALLRRILGGDLAGVLNGPPPPGTDEVAELATEAMEAHLDRRIRSVRSTASL